MSQLSGIVSSRRVRLLGANPEFEDSEGIDFLKQPETEEEKIKIEHFTEEPYYAECDESTGYRNDHSLALRIDATSRPSLGALIHTCTKERAGKYVDFEQGMWIEYLSNDMKWKVAVVNRVIKQPPDDWDFDKEGTDPPEERMIIYYNVGLEGIMDKDEIRAPELGLKAIFGQRPWLWQQFTILQLERRLRFDEGHEMDFEEIDILKFGAKRYDTWLNDPKNQEFKALHDKYPLITQQLLKSHILTPFEQMDFLTERHDKWDFNDGEISVYTYLSVLGSGFPTTFMTMIIQFLAPLILLYNSFLLSDGQNNLRFENVVEADGTVRPAEGFIPHTTFSEFCIDHQNPQPEGKILITLVILIYITTVLPDSWLSFFRTSGGANSTYSRINSLRNIIWEQNDDDILQQIGFQMDRFMNTGYICLLYTMMLFILIQTPNVLDIILNALAVEFIHQIDERIANSDWWDEKNRWIMAGTTEMVIQGTLRLRILENPYRLCTEFGIDKGAYKAALGTMLPLKDYYQAQADEKNSKYMTLKERTFEEVARRAQEDRDRFTVKEYRKQLVQFGYTSKVMELLGLRKVGLFQRYTTYRVWSRWEKVLFLPQVPEYTAPDELINSDQNAVKVITGKSDLYEFGIHVAKVLSGMDLIYSVYQSGKHGYYEQIPLKILLGLIEIFFYYFQMIFPFIILACLAFVPFCY